MRRRPIAIFLATLLLTAGMSANVGALDLGGLLGTVGKVAKQVGGTEESGGADVAAGLREALRVGTERAVTTLGRTDGFLGDDRVRIPLPDSVQPLEKILRAVGQGHYVDDFRTSMNRAAEAAVPEAAEILGKAVSSLTIADAQAIFNGPDDAATRYFEKTTRGELFDRFLPMVQEATEKTEVTARYKSMRSAAGPLASAAGVRDLDEYVTDKGLDGLFTMLALEEKRIREDPVARTTDLLRQVFGDQ